MTREQKTMTEREIRETIKKIDARLSHLKLYHSNGDDNPWGWGTVSDAKRTLRNRKKQLKEQLQLS